MEHDVETHRLPDTHCSLTDSLLLSDRRLDGSLYSIVDSIHTQLQKTQIYQNIRATFVMATVLDSADNSKIASVLTDNMLNREPQVWKIQKFQFAQFQSKNE